MTEELKPIDVSKYTVTESGNVIRTDNKETLKNALERIVELEKENRDLKTDLELERKNKTNVFAELNDETARSNSMLMDELAEAGEIIKDFLLWENSWHEKKESKYALLKRAEDFIKE